MDRIFIGQGVGPLAISGLALTFPLTALVTAIGTLIGVGSAARISIVLGMRDIKWARNILGNAFVLTFLLSAVLITCSMLYLDDILRAFGGSDQTIPYAKDYLRIVIPGSVLSNLSYSFSNIMRASGYPSKSMYTILIGVGLNILLDPLFIFGFGMEIKGAAVATVISMFVSSLFVLSHFFNPKHPVHFRRDCWVPKKRIIRNIVSIGDGSFPDESGGEYRQCHHEQSAGPRGRRSGDRRFRNHQQLRHSAIVMTAMGLCQGMQPIVGFNYGAQKLKRMKDVLKLTIRTATLIMVVGFVACELVPRLLVRAFTTDPGLIDISARGLRLAYVMLPVVGFQIVVSTFFQSISKAWKAIFMGLSRQVIFLIPALYFFSRWFGLTGVWLSIPFADFLASAVAALFLLSEKRVFYPKAARRV